MQLFLLVKSTAFAGNAAVEIGKKKLLQPF